jgi:hypothetical protein
MMKSKIRVSRHHAVVLLELPKRAQTGVTADFLLGDVLASVSPKPRQVCFFHMRLSFENSKIKSGSTTTQIAMCKCATLCTKKAYSAQRTA